MAKAKRKNCTPVLLPAIMPLPGRFNHQGGISSELIQHDEAGKALIRRYKTVWDCPLDRYLSLGALTPQEYEAGMKFRHAYFRTVLRIRVEDVSAGCAGDIGIAPLMPIYSERLLREAFSVLSEKQKAVILAVCGHDEVAGTHARLKTLHRGLERLCDVWKLS